MKIKNIWKHHLVEDHRKLDHLLQTSGEKHHQHIIWNRPIDWKLTWTDHLPIRSNVEGSKSMAPTDGWLPSWRKTVGDIFQFDYLTTRFFWCSFSQPLWRKDNMCLKMWRLVFPKMVRPLPPNKEKTSLRIVFRCFAYATFFGGAIVDRKFFCWW